MGTGNGRGLKSHLDDGGKTRVYGWIRKLLPGLNKVVSRDQKDGKRQGLFVRSLNPSRPEFSLDPFLSLSGSFHWLNYYLFTKLFVFHWYLILAYKHIIPHQQNQFFLFKH